MISIFLQGGLGNQLFQIAIVIAYCIEYNEKCIFTYDNVLKMGVERKTYWNTLLKKCKGLTNFNNSHVTNDYLLSLSKYMESDFTYNEVPVFKQDIMLVGYYQSYKYFHSVREVVFDIMGLRDEQNKIQNNFKNLRAENTSTICLHFRLGDYKHKQEFHPVLPYEYYEKALNSLSVEILNNSSIYYLCEEEDNTVVSYMVHKLCAKFHLSLFIKLNDDMSDWEQLLFMSCCQVNIIANSSFSCWAGYLNNHPEKIIMYPNQWFGPKIQADTKDLFLPDWIQITI